MDRNAIEITTLTDSQQQTSQNFEELIEQADNLARDGDLGPAYSVYLRASKHKEFKPSHLSKLIDCLVENLKMAQQKSNDLFSLITCEICYGILIDPVTIDCGHTFCNTCLSGLVNCAICSIVITPEFNRKVNVLLNKLLKSWLPDYKEILDRRKKVEQLLSNKMYSECMDIIEESLRSGKKCEKKGKEIVKVIRRPIVLIRDLYARRLLNIFLFSTLLVISNIY